MSASVTNATWIRRTAVPGAPNAAIDADEPPSASWPPSGATLISTGNPPATFFM